MRGLKTRRQNAERGAVGVLVAVMMLVIIGAGVVAILIAPMVSRMLRFFPPVVTGTIIAVIGISLMRVGINWIFGNPFGPTAPAIVDPVYAKWLADVTSPGSSIPQTDPSALYSFQPEPDR